MRRKRLERTLETAFAVAIKKRGWLKRITDQLETASDDIEKES
jgi:hypothetical protein